MNLQCKNVHLLKIYFHLQVIKQFYRDHWMFKYTVKWKYLNTFMWSLSKWRMSKLDNFCWTHIARSLSQWVKPIWETDLDTALHWDTDSYSTWKLSNVIGKVVLKLLAQTSIENQSKQYNWIVISSISFVNKEEGEVHRIGQEVICICLVGCWLYI